jgi:serine/threonine protein kinase
MPDTTTSHPSAAQLAAFDRGDLRPAQWAEIERHLAGCSTCCDQLESLPDDPLVLFMRAAAKPAGEPGGPLPADVADTVPVSRTGFSAPGSQTTTPTIPAELQDHPRYEMGPFLGGGGMGTVFLAEHRLMERRVAVKVIRKDYLVRAGAVERFRQEVRAAARLAHPNIVTAYDADQAGDVHFLVMEFVPGESLDRVVEREGPQPVERACRWIRQAALGLQHAHEHGMVHRDIKPHNLLRTPDDQIKILDFGLARFAWETESGESTDPRPTEARFIVSRSPDPTSSAPDASHLTQSGTVLGTPDFIAPEQALRSHEADARADIYSLGCTLYFLLAGRPPFSEATLPDKLAAHQTQQPQPLTELRPDLPAALLSVVDRMLAKDPARRWQSPREVADALTPFAAGPLPLSGPGSTLEERRPAPRAAPHRRVGFLIPTTVVLLAAAGGWWALSYFSGHNGGPEGSDSSAEARRRDTRSLTGDDKDSARQHPRKKTPPRGELRRFGGKGKYTNVAFSRLSQLALAAGPDHVVHLWDLVKGKEVARFRGHDAPVRALAIAKNERRALSGDADGTIQVWDLVNKRRHQTLQGHRGEIRGLAFIWDNRHAFSIGADGQILLWNTDRQKPFRSLTGDRGLMTSLGLDRYGILAVIGKQDGFFDIWDLALWRKAAV